MYQNRIPGGSHNQHNKLPLIDEYWNKIKDEINQLQNQLQNQRIELEKLNMEKETIQRQMIMYNELFMNQSLEVHKHVEISKRLTGILSQIIPHLPVEHQGTAIQAAERAKQITPQELQQMIGTQLQQQQQQFAAAAMMPGMANLNAASMLAANPAAAAAAAAAGFNPLAMAAASGAVKPEDANTFLNNLLKSGGMPNMLAGLANSAQQQQQQQLSNSILPGTSSASVPPPPLIADESRHSSANTSSSRAASSSARPRSSADSPSQNHNNNNRSTPNASSATPNLLKRTKLEPEDGDGELEIDVQNDVEPAVPSVSHTNGNSHKSTSTSSHNKDGGRESAHSTSSRDSTTPSSRKRLHTPNQNLLQAGGVMTPDMSMLMQQSRFPFINPMPYANFQPGMVGGLQTNGTKPSYAFKVVDGKTQPVTFPLDPESGVDVPKNMKRIFDLPHGDVVCSVTLAKDSTNVYTGARGSVKIWDIRQGASSTGGVVKLEPTTTLECLNDVYIRSSKLYNDGMNLIVAGESETICIWDLQAEKIKSTLNCNAQACYAIAISEDNKLCFACCADGKIILWDLLNETQVGTLEAHTDGVSCVDLAPNGEKIWTGSLDKTVRSWDIRSKSVVETYSLDCQIFSLSCCPTDDYVVAGLENNNVEVLNTIKKEKYVLHDHESCVLALKFAHSGKWFISSGKDNSLNTWRTPYGFRLVKTRENASVLSCDISHDDKYIATGSGDKKATVYEVGY